MQLPVVEDQGLAPLRRHQQGGPALPEGGCAPLEAAVEVHQEGELAVFRVVEPEASVRVRGEPLAGVVAVEAEPLVQPDRLPAAPLLDEQPLRAFPPGARQFGVVQQEALVVADVLTR